MASTTPTILYDNRFSTGTITASSTGAGYDGDSIRDGRTYTFWKSTSTGSSFTVMVDTSKSTCKADAFGMISHNLYSAGATFYIEHSSNSSDWTGVTTYVPTNDNAIFGTFVSSTNRYWRIRVDAPTTTPYIGVLMVGIKTQFPAYPALPVTPYTVGIEVETARSKAGHLLGNTVRYKPLEINVTIMPSEDNYNFYNTTFKTFWNNHGSELKPFFFVLDSTMFPNDVFYVTLSPESVYSMPMSITSRIDSINLRMVGVKE